MKQRRDSDVHDIGCSDDRVGIGCDGDVAGMPSAGRSVWIPRGHQVEPVVQVELLDEPRSDRPQPDDSHTMCHVGSLSGRDSVFGGQVPFVLSAGQ